MADALWEEVVEKVSNLSVVSVARDAPSKNALKKELKKKQRKEMKHLKDEEKKKVMLGLNRHIKKFQFSMHVEDYIYEYAQLNPGKHLKNVEVNLKGHIAMGRNFFSKLYFYDLFGSCMQVQVVADARYSDMNKVEFSKLHAGIETDDYVSVRGFPGRTKCGKLSIFSNCLHIMPQKIFDAVDPSHKVCNANTMNDGDAGHKGFAERKPGPKDGNKLLKLPSNIELPTKVKPVRKFLQAVLESLVVSEPAKAVYMNQPLSPHLPLKLQLSATYFPSPRIFGAGVAGAVILFPLAVRFQRHIYI